MRGRAFLSSWHVRLTKFEERAPHTSAILSLRKRQRHLACQQTLRPQPFFVEKLLHHPNLANSLNVLLAEECRGAGQ
jgi:hypothetical protein